MKKSANKCTIESLRKIVGLLKEWIDFWNEQKNDPEAHIVENGNHKTGTSIPVFNMTMLFTCGNCGTCKRWCSEAKR